MSSKERSIAERIADARKLDVLLSIEAYCRSEACAVREVQIAVKDHDNDVVASVGQHGLTCPVCSSPMVMHHVWTAAQQRESEDRGARCAVNVQMFIRDQSDGDDALVGLPVDVICDDRLPPTPTGWFKEYE